MPNRFAALAASTILASLAACSSPPPPPSPGALPPWAAQVSIDGKDMGLTHAVDCHQTGWTWTIDTSDQTAGITAVIETGGTVTAKYVRIRNLDGFTGSYWLGNHGTADASLTASTWTISGTIDGFNIDTPALEHASRHFTLKANC